jgi:hypothetical protein
VVIAQLAQTLRAHRKNGGPIRQANAWKRALRERLDLAGLENPLHWLDRVVCESARTGTSEYRPPP